MNLGLTLKSYMDQTPDNVNGSYSSLVYDYNLKPRIIIDISCHVVVLTFLYLDHHIGSFPIILALL
jgi:hypothetical protein